MKDYKITSKQLRNSWIKFYEDKGHRNIGGVSLISDGATGVLFNVAGMQPLMPYLLGEKHSLGKRLVNVQGCLRTNDIDEVGDNRHLTFFEMMGNWSLGDYFKKEKTMWSKDILTKIFNFPIEKIASTVFEGDKNVPRDDETATLLLAAGILKENIYYLPRENNWWDMPDSEGSPCGPDNEWFFITDKKACGPDCTPACDCGRFVEIGNDVYMQYKQIKTKKEGLYEELTNKNVDTGFGLERNLAFLNGTDDVYTTDLFAPAISRIEKLTGLKYENNKKAFRIIADHIRSSVMLIGDEKKLVPNNVAQGYILRRLIRRAIRYANMLELPIGGLLDIAKIYIDNIYKDAYPNLTINREFILTELKKEEDRFDKMLEGGLKEFGKLIANLKQFAPDVKVIAGAKAFRLFDTFGFPLELTVELAKEQGYDVDIDGYNKAFDLHREKSNALNKGEAKGGLQDSSVETTKLHTATHLLLAALRKLFGTDIEQKGSNITAERLRFDFNFDKKLTDEEVLTIETFVNNAIKAQLPIERIELKLKDAKAKGAYGIHKAGEDDVISVYKIADVDFQICGGPHVANTQELGSFKIDKQEAVSAGIRRIKAIINS